jgi:hypothetical protein
MRAILCSTQRRRADCLRSDERSTPYMLSILRVEVPWVELQDDRDPLWQANFCLYAYLHP